MTESTPTLLADDDGDSTVDVEPRQPQRRQRRGNAAPRGAARAAILRVFAERPEQVIFADQLAELTGFSIEQVRSAVYTARNSSEVVARDLVVIQRGLAWRWEGAPLEPVSPARTQSAHDVADGDERRRQRTRRSSSTPDDATPPVGAASAPDADVEYLELVSRLDDGDILVRDHDRVVYRARRIQ